MNRCHEIVFFHFNPGTPFETQRAHMESMLGWVRSQPGFVERAGFHDATHDTWVDHLTWLDPASAQAAFAAFGQASELAPVRASIASDGIVAGHFRRVL